MNDKTSLNYRDAGVDIDAGNALVKRIKPLVARTHRPEVLAGIGGFGGLFELPLQHYYKPVLVSGTDGVGTKLRLALMLELHDLIGIDLVAMCVNDIVVQGAEPLFFLDYYATGHLNVDLAASVITGIVQGCEISGCALLGGETAEMPGMYAGQDYDLAGFAVGIVEREHLLDGHLVQTDDVIVGLASSGPHANGYSLIRKIIERKQIDLQHYLKSRTLADHLLEPTRIYVPLALSLLRQGPIHAFAHITGGGITENLPRVLPEHTRAVIDPDAWPHPDIFEWLQREGNIEPAEMLRIFNCGVGMIVIVPADYSDAVIKHGFDHGITAWEIGRVEASETTTPSVFYIQA